MQPLPGGHSAPQCPQFRLLLSRETQIESQDFSPDGQSSSADFSPHPVIVTAAMANTAVIPMCAFIPVAPTP